MSEIDSYKHKCLGIITCPSSFKVIYGGIEGNPIAIYRLDEDAFDSNSFHGKAGDILLGGGSGESPALRIALPEAFYFYTNEAWDEFNNVSEIVKAFWTMNQAYMFGEGFAKLGWTPNKEIEDWLAEHVLAFLGQNHPEEYQKYLGANPFEENGSICRLPTQEEIENL